MEGGGGVLAGREPVVLVDVEERSAKGYRKPAPARKTQIREWTLPLLDAVKDPGQAHAGGSQ
ncbi:hypothetical protein ACFWIZ_31810, partial [Streptomyces sp. NPDC127044]